MKISVLGNAVWLAVLGRRVFLSLFLGFFVGNGCAAGLLFWQSRDFLEFWSLEGSLKRLKMRRKGVGCGRRGRGKLGP